MCFHSAGRHLLASCRGSQAPWVERYLADYGRSEDDTVAGYSNAFQHFSEMGRYEGKIWHSELCGEDCGYARTSFSWVDARTHGETVQDMFITPLYQQHSSHTLASRVYGPHPHMRS